MHRSIVILFGVTFFVGCANPINQRTAQNYYVAGEQALAAGNLALAKQNFSRALLNAQLGRMGPTAEAQAATKLAQVLGNLCEYDEAERAFLQAITAEESAYGPSSPRTFPTRTELAQFSFDIGRFKQAAEYYEKAFSVGSSAMERADPNSYALLLDDYAVALANSGNAAGAADAKSKASALRGSAKGSGPGVAKTSADYVPYPKSCK